MRWSLLATLFTLSLGSFYGIGCSTSVKNNTDELLYPDQISDLRKRKDLDFKNNLSSPIPKKSREAFTGLKYFQISKNWKIDGELQVLTTGTPVRMTTTNGEISNMLLYANISFVLESQKHQLQGFVLMNSLSNELFIPFYDETNGSETYGGGRYLEIPFSDTSDSVTLDFNLAYNPYCHYNGLFSCPIPPIRNTLNAKIRAGEKKWY